MFSREATQKTIIKRKKKVSIVDRVEMLLLSKTVAEERIIKGILVLSSAYFLAHVIAYLLR